MFNKLPYSIVNTFQYDYCSKWISMIGVHIQTNHIFGYSRIIGLISIQPNPEMV